VDKINRGLASIGVLKRGKTAGAHQRRTVRDGAEQTFLGGWTAVFADPHPLPPPPRPPFDGSGLSDDDASLPDTASPSTEDQGPSDPAQPDPPGPPYSKLQAALHKVSESLFTEGDVKAAVRSLKDKAPGEDGTPITVFKGRFGCSEGGIDDEVLQAVDLYADTLAVAYNNATQIGLPDCQLGTSVELSQRHKYSATEREASAVRLATAHFRECLGPVTHFVVVTDRAALTHTQDVKDPSSRVARWHVYLQSYHFTVQRRRGRDNLGADALSRPPHLLPVFTAHHTRGPHNLLRSG
jgi:hypothetical protein